MWICTNKTFLSVVQPAADDPANLGDCLLVRARLKGHIESVFPDADVVEVPGRDYQFRAYVRRGEVAVAVMRQVQTIDYPNFKNSVRNPRLHDAYACTWGVLAQMQEIPPYETMPRKRKPFAVDPAHPYSNN